MLIIILSLNYANFASQKQKFYSTSIDSYIICFSSLNCCLSSFEVQNLFKILKKLKKTLLHSCDQQSLLMLQKFRLLEPFPFRILLIKKWTNCTGVSGHYAFNTTLFDMWSTLVVVTLLHFWAFNLLRILISFCNKKDGERSHSSKK